MTHEYGCCVRVRSVAAAAPSYDLIVEHLDGSAWVELDRYNDMSNDHAYGAAHNRAINARERIARGQTP